MPERKGFTLIELLVVIAILSLLLGIFAPGLWRIWHLANVDVCYNNIHQLSVAWMGYQANNDGYLINGLTKNAGGQKAWAYWGNEWPSNANRRSLITNGALFPYVPDIRIYKCPVDPVHHLRSYSITSIPNGEGWYQVSPLIVKRYGLIKDPANQLVFVEENDHRSISNMNSFIQELKSSNRNRWVDYVANYHEDSDNVGFADGHAEHWKWMDQRTIQNAKDQVFFRPDNGNPDLRRFREKLFNGAPGAF